LALFKTTSCKAILTPKGYNLQSSLLDRSALPHHEVQEALELLADGEIREYKFNKSFEAAKDDPLVVLHTSGSTGLPKPIVLTHAWMASFDKQKSLEPWNGLAPLYTAFETKTIFCSVPPFHVGSPPT
jgi:acyl-coenzyme A synthetase/AMP-(fatty) acid ligase